MAFLDRILEPPRYGFTDSSGAFLRPTSQQIWSELFYRLNVFRDRRNWLAAWGWVTTLWLAIPFFVFVTMYFSLPLALLGFVYSMVALGTHGTVYLHRYGNHRAYKFRNLFWVWICKNLVIKIIPEETYVVSHHNHHQYSEKPGDPYNVNGGWLYCFLADVNHQMIARNMTPADYQRVVGLVAHMAVKPNSYEEYLRWGTVARPLRTILEFVLNWAFWYGAFYFIGGHALATAIFGMSAIWAFGIRTFNYDGHGRGKDKRQDGIDFNREDLSINQIWPGYVASEWHNNHHMCPNSARNGFLPYQLDLAWIIISTWHKLGIVASYRDDTESFLNRFVRKTVPAQAAAAPSAEGIEAPAASSRA